MVVKTDTIKTKNIQKNTGTTENTYLDLKRRSILVKKLLGFSIPKYHRYFVFNIVSSKTPNPKTRISNHRYHPWLK
jgi:hypothetical protein